MIGYEGQEEELKKANANTKAAFAESQKATEKALEQMNALILQVPEEYRPQLRAITARTKAALEKHDIAALTKLTTDIPKIIQDAISGNR